MPIVDSDFAVVVDTPYGSLRGLPDDRGKGVEFRGVRFATAERFKPPVPVTSWFGVYDATSYGAQCPQSSSMLERALGGGSLAASEDCLSLNVFTPACDDRARPVVVWIHGGAFTTGTGSTPWYHGGALATRGDVVVVTINYRLGVFGFSGRTNCGLRDQVVALQWVQACIASFGGDPAAVTIMGESAGGASVVALMATPGAAGLFHHAVAMSPSLKQLRSGERADEALAEFLTVAEAASLDELRDAPVDLLIDVQSKILAPTTAGFTGFSPCCDGDFVTLPILETAVVNPIPFVIGTTRDEMRLFHAFDPAVIALDEVALLDHAERRFPGRGEHAVDQYRGARIDADVPRLYSAILTDEVFRRPMLAFADARAAAGMPTWTYWFTWASPAFDGVLGSCHAVDIPFAFHNFDRDGVEQFIGNDSLRTHVADAYAGAMIALAQRGEPGWPRHDLETRPMMVFDVHSRVEHDPDETVRRLW